MENLDLYELMWLAFMLGFGWAAGVYALRATNGAIDLFLEKVGLDFRSHFKKQSQPIVEYPERLRAAGWGDGQQTRGTVNIFCDEWQTVIADDVQKEIAHEMVRRYNRGPK